MKLPKVNFSNILFVVVILLLIIPTTRKPIQVFIQKGFAQISPSYIEKSNQKMLSNYHWKLVGSDGVLYNLEQAKNKVIFINFWATWCPPCIAEMPSIIDLYNDYGKDVVFLLVTNENKRIVTDFLSKNNYEINFYNPLFEAPKLFNTSSIPQTYLIDKTGHIVIEKTGAANWNGDSVRSLIDELLKAN